MSKYRPNNTFRRWLESKALVVVGYFDDVKGVSLNSLLASWVDVTQVDHELFSDHSPYAANHFQVTVIDKDDPRIEEAGILLRVLDGFLDCPHLKVWSDGELMDGKDVSEVIEAIKEIKERNHG